MSLSEHQQYWDNQALERIEPRGDNVHIHGGVDRYTDIVDFLKRYDFKKRSVLEVGAGCGLVAAKMKSEGLIEHYVNLDISKEYARFVNDALFLRSFTGSVHNMPFGDNQFDAVWLFDVLEHINPKMRKETARELYRVTKDAGALFINNPVYSSRGHQEFEWLMFDEEIIEMFSGWRINEKTTRLINMYPYEFIVLTKWKN